MYMYVTRCTLVISKFYMLWISNYLSYHHVQYLLVLVWMVSCSRDQLNALESECPGFRSLGNHVDIQDLTTED